MMLRPFLNHETSCASYLFGCTIDEPEPFAEALLRDMPDRPPRQAAIVAANRSGGALTSV